MTDRLEVFQSQIGGAAADVRPDVEIEYRKMFGGMAAYARGRVFAVTSSTGFGLKLSEPDRADILQVEGAAYLHHDGDVVPSKQYIEIPAHIKTDPDRLAEWVGRSIAYALTLPLPKRKSKR
jgi:TfoX/Sxy family transcriptional regulator of competence genes